MLSSLLIQCQKNYISYICIPLLCLISMILCFYPQVSLIIFYSEQQWLEWLQMLELTVTCSNFNFWACPSLFQVRCFSDFTFIAYNIVELLKKSRCVFLSVMRNMKCYLQKCNSTFTKSCNSVLQPFWPFAHFILYLIFTMHSIQSTI